LSSVQRNAELFQSSFEKDVLFGKFLYLAFFSFFFTITSVGARYYTQIHSQIVVMESSILNQVLFKSSPIDCSVIRNHDQPQSL